MSKEETAIDKAESQIDVIEGILKDASDNRAFGDYSEDDCIAVLFAENPVWAAEPERVAISFGRVAEDGWHEAGRVALDAKGALNPGCRRFGDWDWSGNVDGQEISCPLMALEKTCRWVPLEWGAMFVKPDEGSPSHEELLKAMAKSVNAAYEGI